MKQLVLSLVALAVCLMAYAHPTVSVELDGDAKGKVFEGIGFVNGGGGTSVLLKDYPEPQRSQILDMVYKPMFGASVSALLVEIPGDGNATQGSMPSHRHTRDDLSYSRGYTWWILNEAKRRNADLTLDGAAWSAPGWIGGGQFWSQDAADYYVDWLRGLRHVYGHELTAIGCRNEKGDSKDFVKLFRRTLDANGFDNVRIHAFDNWYRGKLDFVKDMLHDAELRDAVDIIGGHIFYVGDPVSAEERDIAERLGKPIWNTEDHVYLKGFDCLISIVQCFNHNFIRSGVTKVVNWYDVCGTYPLEPYSQEPPAVLAYEPWSGHYKVREALWGYAHYGQFTKVGWTYMSDGCRELPEGGSMVALRSASGDYSVIIETKRAGVPQTVRIRPGGSLSGDALCVWQSDSVSQFVRRDDIRRENGEFVITAMPNTVYSLSTLRGQQKGTYAVPESRPFPLPYHETFEQYSNPEEWGCLPHYTADINGAFELVDRPDGKGRCVRQVVPAPTICWAPDWHCYTILGDSAWRDYDVSADIMLNLEDAAGVMGRICDVGSGYGFIPKCYVLKLDDRGNCILSVIRGKIDKKKLEGDAEQQAFIRNSKDEGEGGEKILSSARLKNVKAGGWHNLKLRFEGSHITGYADNVLVVEADDTMYSHGMAGMLAEQHGKSVSTPFFDNVQIAPVGESAGRPAREPLSVRPLYPKRVADAR
ncbi:MAG: galactosylceramidase [Prevotellaceae bacterium]|nr:galactosylceramidase [Prevotellaceae bacterium]MDO4932419.1 galactosylceramidase [Prevotellaceae bacterium]